VPGAVLASKRAAVTLLDPILVGAPADVESLFRDIRRDKRRLVAQGADVGLLEQGRVFAALRSAAARSDWSLVRRYDADRDRARRASGSPRSTRRFSSTRVATCMAGRPRPGSPMSSIQACCPRSCG